MQLTTMATKTYSYEVLGIGAACIDLLIQVNDDFVRLVSNEKGGEQLIDFEGLNKIVQDSGVEPKVAIGGSCANAIKGLASLGMRCALLSQIGSDHSGNYIEQYMRKKGVIPLFSTSNQPTALTLCLITPDGQRTMRFFEGCSREMSEKCVSLADVKGVKIVHMEAYCLRNQFLIEKVAHIAKEMHVQVSLDLSSFEIVHQYHQRINQLLTQYVDIAFANQDEIKALTGLSPYEGCWQLQKMCPIAVVLMGEEGCLIGCQGKVFKNPAFPTQVVDTTGAGDLFASGFLYGYLQGFSLKECASLGNLLGSCAVEVMGADIPEEKWLSIRQTLQKSTNI